MRVRYHVALGVVGVAVLATSVYRVVTGDAFVRRTVGDQLARFVRAPAHFGRASFTFLDGLVVEDVALLDPYDPTGLPVVEVARVRADWGLFLLGGEPRLTTVELERPRLRVRRRADGSLSLSGLIEPPEADERERRPLPTIRIRGGTLVYDDDTVVRGGPVTLEEVDATVEPVGGAWDVRVSAHAKELGPVALHAFRAPGDVLTANVDLVALPVSKAVFGRLRFPGADDVAQLGIHGTVKASAEVAYVQGSPPRIAAKLDLAGLRTPLVLPDPHSHEAPAPFEVSVQRGTAELREGAIDLTDLALVALGGTLRCARARVEGFGTESGPTVEGELVLEDLAVDEPLRASLPRPLRETLTALALRGRLDAQAKVRGSVRAPRIEADAMFSRGRLRFDGWVHDDGRRHGFPWEIDEVSVAFAYRTGAPFTFEGTGRHGPAKVRAAGRVEVRDGDPLPDVRIHAEDVPIDDDLRAGLANHVEHLDRWRPNGVVGIDVHAFRDPHVDGPHGVAVELTIRADGRAGLRPRCFDTPLRDVTGRIEWLQPPRGDHRGGRIVLTDLRGKGDGVELRADGRVDWDGPAVEEELTIVAAATEASKGLAPGIANATEYVPDAVKQLVRDLGLGGAMDVRAEIAGDAERRRDRVRVTFRDGTATGYRDIPFAVAHVTGAVAYDGDVATLEGLQASALGTTVRASGRLAGLASGQVEPSVVVEAAEAPLGEVLRRSLGPLGDRAAAFWDKLRPEAPVGAPPTRADVHLTLRPSTDPTPLELRLDRIRGRLRPLGLELDVSGGAFRFDGRIATAQLDAAVHGARSDIRSASYDVRTGQLAVEVVAEGLRFPDDIAPLLTAEAVERIRANFPGRVIHLPGLRALYDPERDDALDLRGDVVIEARTAEDRDAPGLAPEGVFHLRRLTLWFPPGLPVAFDGSADVEAMRLRAGVLVEDFHGPIVLAGRLDDDGVELAASTTGARLLLHGLPVEQADLTIAPRPRGSEITLTHGVLWRGLLTGRVGPGGSPRVATSGELHLRDADLSRLAREGSGITGRIAKVDVHFRTPTGEADDLDGSIDVEITDGRLGGFGVISRILNIFPGAGDLTQAYGAGHIRGRTIDVRDLTVDGPNLRLSEGRGTIGLNGELDVLLKPEMKNALWVVPPLWVPTLLGRLKIHVGGEVGSPVIEQRWLGAGLDAERR